MAKGKRKIPMRMCVGCRERRDKRELVRVVRSPEGEIDIDATGKKPGRGAYICPARECLEKAMKSKALEKSLQIQISREIYEKLAEEI